MTRPRVWNDRALEWYVMTGAGAGALLGTLTWALCALVIGVPPWEYLIAFMGAAFGVATLAMGLNEIRRSRRHRARMRACAEITANFERLLAGRRPGQ